MTPEMAARYPTPEDLRRAPLIFDESTDFLRPRCDWPAWFRAVGIGFAPEHGARFSQADHAVDAALAGAGVVLDLATGEMLKIQDPDDHVTAFSRMGKGDLFFDRALACLRGAKATRPTAARETCGQVEHESAWLARSHVGTPA